jgi:hypothetical protein
LLAKKRLFAIGNTYLLLIKLDVSNNHELTRNRSLSGLFGGITPSLELGGNLYDGNHPHKRQRRHWVSCLVTVKPLAGTAAYRVSGVGHDADARDLRDEAQAWTTESTKPPPCG